MIEILELNEWNDFSEIDAFIESSLNGTLYHEVKFQKYHSEDKFPKNQYNSIYFSFLKSGEIIGFISGKIVNNKTKLFKSPIGSSYGGFIFKKGVKFVEIEEIIRLTIDKLRQARVDLIELTVPLECYYRDNKKVYNYLEYVLCMLGSKIIKMDLVMVHEVKLEQDLLAFVNAKTRTELKQCFKANLRYEIVNYIEETTYDLLVESQKRLGSQPTHTYEELKVINKLYPDKIKIFKIFKDDILLSGIICFEIRKEILNTFYIFDSEEGRKFKANHFSYYNVLKWANDNKFKYVDFGPTSFGFKPHNTLINFKEKFGANPYLRKNYQLNL